MQGSDKHGEVGPWDRDIGRFIRSGALMSPLFNFNVRYSGYLYKWGLTRLDLCSSDRLAKDREKSTSSLGKPDERGSSASKIHRAGRIEGKSKYVKNYELVPRAFPTSNQSRPENLADHYDVST